MSRFSHGRCFPWTMEFWHLRTLFPQGLRTNTGSLTVYTTPFGGIIDDLIVSKTSDYLYVVSNAGCAEKDLTHVKSNLSKWKDVELEVIKGAYHGDFRL